MLSGPGHSYSWLARGVNTEPRWLAPIKEPRDKGAHRPLKTVSRTINGPSNAALLLESMETFVSQIFKTLDGVRCCPISFEEGGLSLRYHSSAALLAGVPRRITDDHRSAASYASKGLTQSGHRIFSVVERGIEYHSVELLIPKWQACELSLKPWKHCGKVLSKMFSCSNTIAIVGKQIYGKGAIVSERQAIAHPAVSCSQIQNSSAVILKIAIQYALRQTVETARSDLPLFAVFSRRVLVRKTQIEIVLPAPSAFFRSDVLIVLYEMCKVRCSIRRKGVDDSIASCHLESAELALQLVDIGSAAWALRANALERGRIRDEPAPFVELCRLDCIGQSRYVNAFG